MKMNWKVVCGWLNCGPKRKTIKVGARINTPWGKATITGGAIAVDLDKHPLTGEPAGTVYRVKDGVEMKTRYGYTVNLDKLSPEDIV